jgi:hypothetical protein
MYCKISSLIIILIFALGTYEKIKLKIHDDTDLLKELSHQNFNMFFCFEN